MDKRIIALAIILIFLLALAFLTLGENANKKPAPSSVAHLELVVLPGENPRLNPSEGNPPIGGGG